MPPPTSKQLFFRLLGYLRPYRLAFFLALLATAVIAATDPIALDLVALRLMGFDEQNIPKIFESMADSKLRITRVSQPEDVVVCEVDATSLDLQRRPLNEIRCGRAFLAHPGWIGHIERKSA